MTAVVQNHSNVSNTATQQTLVINIKIFTKEHKTKINLASPYFVIILELSIVVKCQLKMHKT